MKSILRVLPCMVLIVYLASCAIPSFKPIVSQSSSSTPSTTQASAIATAVPTVATPSNRVSPSPSQDFTDEPEPTDNSANTLEPDDFQIPDYSEEPHTAPDYGIADMKKVGLTNEQYEKVYTMLYAASNAGLYLKRNNKLSVKDYLHFCFWALNELSYNDFDTNIIVGTDNGTSDCYVDLATIQKIVKSAFGIRYTSNYAGSYDDIGIYRKGDRFFFYQVEGGHYEFPYAYKMERLAANKIKISLDIITSGCDDSSFTAKAEAIIQKDPGSIFGYRLISYKKVRIVEPKFTRATASSNLPSKNGRSYAAKNVLDRNINTLWVSVKGKIQWIKVSAAGIQKVSGIIVRYEDAAEDPVINANGCNMVKLEFSDGTYFETNSFCNYVSFGRAIKTSYIKIIVIPNSEYDDPKVGYFIADIIPY